MICRWFLLALMLVSTPALAQSSAADAEHTRLSEEMKRLSGRNAWKGVDDAYNSLMKLSTDQGIKLTYRDHYLGAEAARELGDVNEVYLRLKRAQAEQDTDEVKSWLSDIDQNFGEVKLHADSKYPGNPTLSVAEVPFDPSQRRVIEAAQAALASTRTYDGILPLGKYTYGDQNFEVAAGGGAAVEVALLPKRVQSSGGLAYVGPRIDIGPSFTDGLSPSSSSDLTAAGYNGVGGRVGVGLELGFSTRFGVLAEVGYHGLFGAAPSADTSVGVAPVAPSMNMGFGWLAAAYRVGDLRMALGPVYAVGTAKTNGVADDGSSGAGSSLCSSFEGAQKSTCLADAPVSQSIKAGGAELGLFYGFLNFGKLQSGLGLHAGAQSDTVHWIPWAELSFTIAPAAYRRDG